MTETVYYHGGVPGKRPGDRILPAAMLNLDYTPAYLGNLVRTVADPVSVRVEYRPDLACFTSHLGVARGYAARYVHPAQGAVPGDVYRVDLKDVVLEPDPDFDGPGLDQVYVATCEPVTIAAVVERGVVLNPREQNQAAWPYLWYAAWDEPVHASDGTVQASREMRDNGVTDDYLAIWHCCPSGCTTTSSRMAAAYGPPVVLYAGQRRRGPRHPRAPKPGYGYRSTPVQTVCGVTCFANRLSVLGGKIAGVGHAAPGD